MKVEGNSFNLRSRRAFENFTRGRTQIDALCDDRAEVTPITSAFFMRRARRHSTAHAIEPFPIENPLRGLDGSHATGMMISVMLMLLNVF